MNKERKWPLAIGYAIIVFALTLVLGSLSRPKTSSHRNPSPSHSNLRSSKVSEYMVGACAEKFNDTGQLYQRLTVDKWEKKQQDLEVTFYNPKFLWTMENGHTFEVHAKRGKGHQIPQRDHFEKIVLSQDVEVIRQSNTLMPWRLISQKITLYPEQQISKTTYPVEVFGPQTHIEAKGMNIDFKTGKIDFLHHVQTRYVHQKAAY